MEISREILIGNCSRDLIWKSGFVELEVKAGDLVF